MRRNSVFIHFLILLLLPILSVFARAECKQDSIGYVWCSEFPNGGIERDSTGNIQCGKGRCLRDNIGTVYCSKIEAGGAAKDKFGVIKCLGGCERGSHRYCVKAEN